MVFVHIVHTKSLMIVRHVKDMKKLQSEMKVALPQKLLALLMLLTLLTLLEWHICLHMVSSL